MSEITRHHDPNPDEDLWVNGPPPPTTVTLVAYYRSGRTGTRRCLSRTATELRADAVVLGTSTHAGHRLVGSLAVRLVRAGRWPVTVVP